MRHCLPSCCSPFLGCSVGDLRFRLPVPSEPYGAGLHNTTSFGLACPQQTGVSRESISNLINYINSTNALPPASLKNFTAFLDTMILPALTPFSKDCTFVTLRY